MKGRTFPIDESGASVIARPKAEATPIKGRPPRHCEGDSPKQPFVGGRPPRPGHLCVTQIEHLTVRVASGVILDDVNLTLHCGQLTAIVGRNGAGKTTFMKALLGLVPHTGRVTFNGSKTASSRNNPVVECMLQATSVSKRPSHTTIVTPSIGYVPQSLTLDAESPVSVEDLVTASLVRRPVWLPRRKADRKRARAVLAVTQADSLLDRRAGELSGGEMQRVMLALALHPVPDILLLDEPVSGVDRAGIRMFYDTVSRMRREYDTTVLLISHDLDIVARYADRVVLIDRGIAACGTAEEVYASAPFIETFGHVAVDTSNCNDKNECDS